MNIKQFFFHKTDTDASFSTSASRRMLLLEWELKESDVVTGWGLEKLTWTDDTSIFTMITVPCNHVLWTAVFQCSLWSTTVYKGHWNWSRSSSKVSIKCCCHSCPTTQFSTNYCSISNIPTPITHCSPLTILMNLHSTSTGVAAIHQHYSHTFYTFERGYVVNIPNIVWSKYRIIC